MPMENILVYHFQFFQIANYHLVVVLVQPKNSEYIQTLLVFNENECANEEEEIFEHAHNCE